MRAAWRFLDPLPWYEKLVAIAVALFFFGDHLVDELIEQLKRLIAQQQEQNERFERFLQAFEEFLQQFHELLKKPRTMRIEHIIPAWSKVQLERLAHVIVTAAAKLARTESRDPSIHPVASATHPSEVVE